MRNILRAAAAAAIMVAVVSPLSAQTAVVNMGLSAMDGNYLPLGFGSVPGLSVNWQGRTNFGSLGSAAMVAGVRSSGPAPCCGNLPAFAYSNRVGEFRFSSTGYNRLDGLDLGGTGNYAVNVYGGSYSNLLATFTGTVNGTGHVDIDPSMLSYAGDLIVQWGDATNPNGSGAGFAYGVNNVSVTATPEPASVALIATGLLGLGGFTRYRRRKPVSV